MSEHENAELAAPDEGKPISFASFLESVPPNQIRQISDLLSTVAKDYLSTPDLLLHCSHDACNGLLFFKYRGVPTQIVRGELTYRFLKYICRNCQRTEKMYAVDVRSRLGCSGEARKFGELPQFGPPISPQVLKLVGPDRDLFLAGRRSENQGLGIGAFAYYRRVVESQKNRIFERIIRIAEKFDLDAELISELRKAQNETQFRKAVEAIKHAMPETLLMNGHNPLQLLYMALSKGIHEQSDEECWSRARDIRIVLTGLADRLAQLLKDEAELSEAVARLTKT